MKSQDAFLKNMYDNLTWVKVHYHSDPGDRTDKAGGPGDFLPFLSIVNIIGRY